MIYFANIRRSGGMVDTKDSKSFVSDGVRVQVSSPVSKLSRCTRKLFFYLTKLFVWDRLELVAEHSSALSRLSENPKMTLTAHFLTDFRF